MLLSATLGAALAEPALYPDSAPGPATTSQGLTGPRTVRVATSGGVDRWADALIPLESLRFYVDDAQRGPDLTLAWSYSGDLAAWGVMGALDHHSLALTLGPNGSPWTAALDARGSFAVGWTELHLAPSWSWSRARWSGTLNAGPALRVAPQLRRWGPNVSLDTLWCPSSNVGFLVSYDLNLWPGEALPRTVQDLDLLLSWTPGPRVLLLAGAGSTLSWSPGAGLASDPSAWLSGLPPAGSASVRELVAVERSIGRYAFLRAEVGAQELLGADQLAHVMALGGGGFRLYRPDLGPQAAPGPYVVDLNVVAPGATSVSVIGSFTQWQPVAMWPRAGGRWTIEVTLEAGQYEYSYLIDGVPTTPEEAEIRRDDGFGGVNGVLIVPGVGGVYRPVDSPGPLDSAQTPLP